MFKTSAYDDLERASESGKKDLTKKTLEIEINSQDVF